MVYYRETFASEEEARAWVERVLRDYHPAGYGTYLKIRPDPDKPGQWLVTGSRGSSCD